MRTALVAALVGLLALTGCGSKDDAQPSASATTVDPTKVAATQILLAAPTNVAVRYVEALRKHDAAAIYAMASAGLRQAVSRTKFLRQTDLSGVTAARISDRLKVGKADDGSVYAIAPIQVTVDGDLQDGRLILVAEGNRWRFLDSVAPDQAPVVH